MTQQVDLIVQKSDGSLAPRGTDFIALGCVFVVAENAPHLDAAAGTLTNIRKPITVADDVVESVDTGTDSLELTAHGRETGDGPFASDEAIGSLAIGAQFWVIVDDDDNYGVASSLANAYAGTRVALTGTETGATISDIDGVTRRGIDGHFTYEATSDEEAYGISAIIVDGTDYERELGFGAMSTVDSGEGDVLLEGAITRDDFSRILLRTMAAKFSKVGNVFTFRNLADTKDSHTGTVTASGRLIISIIDPT